MFHPQVKGPVTSGAVDLRHVVHFPVGLPGFERCRSFIVMEMENDNALHYLTATDGPNASFVVIDPRRVLVDYRCDLADADAVRLGATAETPLLWLAIVTVEGDGTVTANLRAPIVINPAKMIGCQVIPQNTSYSIRHVLLEAE